MDQRSNRARNSFYHNATPFCQGWVLAKEGDVHHALRPMNAVHEVFSASPNPLQWRAAEAHSHFIGAVLGASFAHLIGVTHVATTHTNEVLLGPVVGHRSNHYSITVDVDIGRVCSAPSEIHRMPPLHPTP